LKKRLKKILADFLPENELMHVYNSYDIVGNIAIIRLTGASKKYSQAIAKALMKVHKNVKTVLAQTSPVHGDFRLRRLEHVAGIKETVTVHRELGCLLAVDVEECYFSPRLLFERMRIAKQIQVGEVVVNMFAGVGSFSIVIAKHSDVAKVYSIDVNPVAFSYMQKNVRLNRVYGRVVPILGDAKQIIETRLNHVADRVLMPLPEKALEYLPYTLQALKKPGGLLHYYDFEHATKTENSVEKVKKKVAERLTRLDVDFEFLLGRVVRATGPNWYQVVLDMRVKGFGKFNK